MPRQYNNGFYPSIGLLLAGVSLLVLAMFGLMTQTDAKPTDAVSQQEQSSALERDIEQISKRITELENKLENAEAEQLAAEEELQLIQEQALLISQNYDLQAALTEQYRANIEKDNETLTSLQVEEAGQYETIKAVLRATEESYHTSFWSVFFGAEDTSEMVYRVQVLSDLIAYEKNQLEDLSAQRENLAALRFAIQEEESRYAEAVRAMDVQRNMLEKRSERLQTRILRLKNTQATAMEELTNLNAFNRSTVAKSVTALDDGTISAYLVQCRKELMDAGIDEQEIAERISTLRNGLSLVGRVSYFWGGRSYSPGWNSEWGSMRPIQSVGSDSYPFGSYFPFGLDCSGFVFWCVLTMYGEDSWNSPAHWMASLGGTAMYERSNSVEWDEKLPGDIVINTPATHTGFYLCTDAEGNELFLHCSSTYGVAVTTSKGTGGFDRAAELPFWVR